MTESEWLKCTDPQRMLEFLRGKVSDRKLRLFACACCRRTWRVINKSRHAVELAERYADGEASLDELAEGHEQAELIWCDEEFGADPAAQRPYRGYSTLWSTDDDATEVAAYCAETAAATVAKRRSKDKPEPAAQCDLLRCIFGKVERRLARKPKGMTSTVRSLAQAIYDDRELPSGHLDTQRMAVLADALIDAGCTNDPGSPAQSGSACARLLRD